jgi:hypothetical protein
MHSLEYLCHSTHTVKSCIEGWGIALHEGIRYGMDNMDLTEVTCKVFCRELEFFVEYRVVKYLRLISTKKRVKYFRSTHEYSRLERWTF